MLYSPLSILYVRLIKLTISSVIWTHSWFSESLAKFSNLIWLERKGSTMLGKSKENLDKIGQTHKKTWISTTKDYLLDKEHSLI